MPNITRLNPAREVTAFDPLDDPFEDFFRGFFLRPMSLESRTLEHQMTLRVDVTENEKEYRVLADIPGVRKEDINVTIDGDEVAISAESKKEKDIKDSDGTVLRSERHYGKLHRTFTLGEEIDQANVQAKYVDGVLDLVLPKVAENSAKKKRITIH